MGKNTRRSSHRAHLKDHSGLLQKVGPHVGPNDAIPLVKANLNVLSETATVVIASGFSIPNGLCRKNKQKVCTTRRVFLNFRTVCSWRHLYSLPLPSF